MHGGVIWCGLGACGANVGAPEAALPVPRAGREWIDAPGSVERSDGAARGRLACQDAWEAALPAPRAGQDRFGAAREERARQDRAKEGVGAPGSNFWCAREQSWCAIQISALPAPGAGQ